ncbi:MAG: P-loop NTPase fold protein [Patescibacteria group bacterium]
MELMKRLLDLLKYVWRQYRFLSITWLLFIILTFITFTFWGVHYIGKWITAEVEITLLGFFILGVALAGLSIFNKNLSYRGFRFSPWSVGLGRDLLDFKVPSKNYAKSIQELEDYVSVVGIFGEMGSGKSSLTRMIVEQMKKDSLLYSYISLTETNETKDFEKLFQERWFEAIGKNYPFRLGWTDQLPVMEAILRESKNGLFAELIRFLTLNGIGLFPTKAKVWDKYLDPVNNPQLCSRRVGKFFGNIPLFSERQFIVVVDELERAHLEEIYRVIEIIERFKYEGRGGLPVQIVFLLCISPRDLQDVITNNVSEKGALVGKFVFDDPKSIGTQIFIPTPSTFQKQIFIKTLFDQMTDSQGLMEREIKKVGSHEIYGISSFPHGSFQEDDKTALQFALSVFIDETPRAFVRTMNSVRFFLSMFSSEDKKLGLPIRLADLIVLEYIKIRFPYLIDFIRKTIEHVRPYSEYVNNGGMRSYFYRKNLQEEKISDIFRWIKHEMGIDVPAEKQKHIGDLLTLVAHRWIEFPSSPEMTDIGRQKYWDSRSTSDPEKMLEWLTFTKESPQNKSTYRISREIYDQHISKGASVIKALPGDELALYARFLSQSQVNNKEKLLETLREVIRRLIHKSTKKDQAFSIEKNTEWDSVYQDAIYRAIFLALAIIEQEPQIVEPSEELKEVWDLLKEIFYSKDVQSYVKLTILNSFGNNTRGSGSVHARLSFALQTLRSKGYEEEIKSSIKHVFGEVKERYFDGKQDIFSKEDHPFFVLYQTWSGKKDDRLGIKQMRNSATRTLERHPRALEVLWKNFPLQQGWRSYEDVLNSRDWFVWDDKGNFNIYIPLGDLVVITKRAKVSKELLAKAAFWGGNEVMNHERLKQRFEIKDDPETLKAVLTANGLYETPNPEN